MSATIPSGQVDAGRQPLFHLASIRTLWPIAIVFAALVGTVYFGTQVQASDDMIRIATATAVSKSLAPQIRSTQYRSEREQGYATITGIAANLTDKPIKNVEALVEFFDRDGSFVKSESALIDLPMLRAGEDSPFTVQARDMPSIRAYRVRFRELLGASIPSTDR